MADNQKRLSDPSTPITFQQENPKKVGGESRKRYDLYRSAKTIGEATQLGAWSGDLKNDLAKGYLKMTGEAAAAAAAAPAGAQAAPAQPKKKASPKKKRTAAEANVEASPAAKKQAASAKASEARAPKAAAPAHAQPPPADLAKPAPALSKAASQPVPPAQEVQVPVAAPPAPLQQLPPAKASLAELQRSPLSSAEQQAPSPLVAAPTESSPPASSSTAAAAAGSVPTPQRAPIYEVDLSFAKLDGKPMKYIKRVMGEAKKLLSDRGSEEQKKEGLEFKLLDRDNLSKYLVTVRDLNKEGQLYKDLQRLGLDASIDLETTFPDEYPLSPPFVRVVYPQLQGGYIFSHGGICFEPLTEKGWAASMTLASLCISIKGILDSADVRATGSGNKETRTVPHYTESGARRDASAISNAHKGGDSRTYMPQKSLKS